MRIDTRLRTVRSWPWAALAAALLAGCGAVGGTAAAHPAPPAQAAAPAPVASAASAAGGAWCSAAQDLVSAHGSLLLHAMQGDDVTQQRQQVTQAQSRLRQAAPAQLRSDVEAYVGYEDQLESAMVELADEAPTPPPGYAAVVDHIAAYSRSQGCGVNLTLGP